MRIAVILFGLPRSLKWTASSIRDNVLSPLRELGEVKSYGHFNYAERVSSSRSRETGGLPPLDLGGLGIEKLVVEDQERIDLEAHRCFINNHDLATGEDRAKQSSSATNFVRALLSLRKAWLLCAEEKADFDAVVFLRGDILYRDRWDARKLIGRLQRGEADILVPDWHSFGGANDRFAIATPQAAHVYANRVDLLDSISARKPVLNAETILLECLIEHDLEIGTFSARAHRVRIDGRMQRDGHKLSIDFLRRYVIWRARTLW